MLYRHKITGEVFNFKSAISAPNYERIDGAASPLKRAEHTEEHIAPLDPPQKEKKAPAKKTSAKKSAPKKRTQK